MVVIKPNFVLRGRDIFGQTDLDTCRKLLRKNVLLKILRDEEEAKDIIDVPDAYVTVYRLVYCGVAIDLQCAVLDLPYIPLDLNVLCDDLLWHVENQTQRCMNGFCTEQVQFPNCTKSSQALG